MSRIGSGGTRPGEPAEMWQPGGTPAGALLKGWNVIAN
jgi:hypothetical protein